MGWNGDLNEDGDGDMDVDVDVNVDMDLSRELRGGKGVDGCWQGGCRM